MMGFGLYSAPLLAQVSFGLNSAAILGIFLATGGVLLYVLRSARPELSRDQDIVFSAIGLICGLILVFQGWRLEPIHQFNLFLIAGVAAAFAAETLRLRAVTAEQARRGTPTVDEERRTSKVYRAEIDEIEPYYDESEVIDSRRRLRGTPEPRSTRSDTYDRYAERDRYDREPRRPPRSRSTAARYEEEEDENLGYERRDRYAPRERDPERRDRDPDRERYSSDRPRPANRRPRPERTERPDRYDRYDRYAGEDDPEIAASSDERAIETEKRPPRRSSSPRAEVESRYEDERPASRPPTRKRRSRPSKSDRPAPPRESRSSSADYADYQPLDDEYGDRDLGDSEY